MGNGKAIKAIGIGMVLLYANSMELIRLIAVLLTPDIKHNLIAVNRLDEAYGISFRNGQCQISNKDGRAIAEAHQRNGLYRLRSEAARPKVLANTTTTTTAKPIPIQRWHERLSHIHENAIRQLSRQAEGIAITDNTSIVSVCRPCLQGKQHVNPNRIPVERTTQRLELIHSDLCGPFSVSSIAGNRYFILYIDDYSRMSWIYFLRSKASKVVTKAFREFKATVENAFGLRIRRFRCDNGRGEYSNEAFRTILSDNGITFEPCAPYTQSQNGVNERRIRTTVEMARSMLYDSGLGSNFWAEACNTANYLINRSPMRALEHCTPYEAWHGRKPTLGHLRRFGYDAYLHLPPEKRMKLQAKTRCCIMLGYVHDTIRIWRLWDPIQRAVINATSIRFDEDNNTAARQLALTQPASSVELLPGDVITSLYEPQLPVSQAQAPDGHTAVPSQENVAPMDLDVIENSPTNVESADEESDTIVVQSLPPKPSRRQAMTATRRNASLDEPDSYEEAIGCPERNQWQKAIKEEHDSLLNNGT
jgi:transposase InsO family protein